MGKKGDGKKKKMPWSEYLLVWGSAWGACVSMGACLPNVYWRLNRMDPQITILFPAERHVSLFTITDSTGGKVSWSALYTNVCLKYTQFAQSQLSITGIISSVAAKYTGGAVLGCAHWQMCKEHVGVRCMQYRSFFCVSAGAGAAIGCGGLFGFASLILKYQEKKAGKKEKKLHEARRHTMISAILAFLCVFLPGAVWVFMSNKMFKLFKINCYYPYPDLKGVGFFLALWGAFSLMLAMCGAIYRYDDQIIPCTRPPKDPGPMPPGMMPPPGGMPPPGMAGMPPGAMMMPPPGAPPM